jgi:hypothetical protein
MLIGLVHTLRDRSLQNQEKCQQNKNKKDVEIKFWVNRIILDCCAFIFWKIIKKKGYVIIFWSDV